MVQSTHSISKGILYAVLVVALCTSSGVFLLEVIQCLGLIFPAKNHGQSYDDSLMSVLFDAEKNDTCAYEIMVVMEFCDYSQEKYDCEEVGCTDQANYINYL